ncbi:MAG: BadF/BadG/BcrA/BcrD ATPase family protein [Deltaproteobacteria bacterium]|nr:BadF/BadG/BcrA/BcrD ATPase family protein [Deltaproteobacteria bacterium]
MPRSSRAPILNRKTPWFAGVDGGGTKTVAVVVDDQGKLIGRGEAGPGNVHVAGWRLATSAVERAIGDALRQAHGARSRKIFPLRGMCVGMAGLDGTQNVRRFESFLRRLKLASQVRVVTDAEILLVAGLADGKNKRNTATLALVSGTGSICWGQSATGETARAGGWGHVVGDEGSGFALGKAALRVFFETEDGRKNATRLQRAILHQLGFPDAVSLMVHMTSPERRKDEFATLAPVVFALAKRGDIDCRRLLAEAARDLAALVDGVVRRLGAKRYTLVLGGGVLANEPGFRKQVAAACGHKPGRIVVARLPALGAARLAIQGKDG